jgi:hypothetical protein
MAHVNFNVTVPLADIVLGTREKAPLGGANEQAAAARRFGSLT